MIRVAAVGQAPPPFGGQTLMLEALVRAKLEHAEIMHVPANFSTGMADMGRFRIRKVVQVLPALVRLARARAAGASVLYFAPSGPSRLAFWRDAALLLGSRWLFPYTVLHFHAAGLTELVPRLTVLERGLLRLAFFRPELAILTSARNPPDDRTVRALRAAVVPLGIDDVAKRMARPPRSKVCRLLFVGVLQESKGVRVLLQAAARLAERRRDFDLVCVGEWRRPAFRREMEAFVAGSALQGRVRFTGVLTGPSKWEQYARADIFCAPTFFEAESFGLSVLEAMSFSLPVVATRWRGLADLIEHGQTGFLVPVRDSAALADRIEALLDDSVLRQRLGALGRARFVERFTLERYLQTIDQLFLELAAEGASR